MRKDKWRFALEAVGLASVVGSLALVAMELNQNNELMAADARYNRLGASTQNLILMIENSPLNINMTFMKPMNERTEEEIMLMESFWFVAFSNANWTFSELPQDELPNALWKRRWSSETTRKVWSENKAFFHPQFISHIDTVILND